MDWTLADYGFAAILLGALGLGLWGIWHGTRRGPKRLLLMGAAFGLFLLVWAEAAVGIFH